MVGMKDFCCHGDREYALLSSTMNMPKYIMLLLICLLELCRCLCKAPRSLHFLYLTLRFHLSYIYYYFKVLFPFPNV